MLEPYQMLLVFYRWWELHIDVSFYFPSDSSGVIISQSSFYPVHDDCIMVLFHHFINAVIIFIICIILSLSAMMILSAASFGIIICISSLPWHSRHLHHPIITSAASFGSMICISSLPFPHCIKHGTGVPGDFIIVFTFFAFQICSMLENTFLFPGSHPIVSLSQTIQLHLFSNYVEMFGKSNWPFRRESLSCVLQRLHVEIYELNEFDELVLVNV